MSDLDQMLASQAAGPRGFAVDSLDTMLASRAAAAPDVPAAVAAGQAINSIPRQLGLTARYGMEGLANMSQIVTEPVRAVTDRVFGQTGKTVPMGVLASQFADKLGLPSPQTADERVVGDATRLVAGAGGMAKASQLAAKAIPAAMEYVAPTANRVAQWAADFGNAARTVPQGLATNLPQQLGAAAGAGLAGGSVREAGGSPLAQGVAALGGGVAGGMGTQTAIDLGSKGVQAVRNMLPGQQQVVQQRLDQSINIILQQQGIDPASVTPAMRATIREQVGRALNTGGDLNPQAVARLADYTRLNMTPTRARLTLDPYDVTQEANAAKLAAATGSRDARLPQIAQDNNRRLVGLIDEMGGSRPVDAYGNGSAVTGTIRAQDEALNRGVSSLYQQARDTSGRSATLDGAAFTRQASQALDEGLLGGALPRSVEDHLNRIARGEVPFTVDYAEQLKTAISNLQRGSNDGQARMALGVVRRALDEAPLMPAPSVNPGNLPAVPGTVPPSPATMGQQSIDAFNQARSAARQRFQWQESSPAIQRALDGANADTFIQQNILSKAAGFDHVAQAAQTINANPAAREAVRTSIVQHLKDAAIGKGGTSQTGNFSGRAMEAALKDIGDRKLGLFFNPAEVETLKSMARTGAFEVFQPRGSAVNNSNSAAGIGALISGITDKIRPVTSKVPGVNVVAEYGLLNPLDNMAAWAMQRPARNIPQGLLMPQQRPPIGQGLLLPGIAAGGLLAAP